MEEKSASLRQLNSPDRAIQERTRRQALDYQLRNPQSVAMQAMQDQLGARCHRENSAALGLLDRDYLRMQLEGHLKDALIYKDAANSSILISLSNQHIQVESSQGPRNDLASLISEKKYEKAFTTALQTSDRSTLSRLCSEVDLLSILSMSPPPLSQIVLLTLLQQLALDLNNNSSQKINWITHLAAAIDPMIAFYVKPVFEELYRRCCYPSIIGPHFPSIRHRVLQYVINSILMKTSK